MLKNMDIPSNHYSRDQKFSLKLKRIISLLFLMTSANILQATVAKSENLNHPTLKKLFSIINEKKTNVAVAADLYTQHELFELIDCVGPHICMLKLHIDCIEDFDHETPKKL